MKQIAVCNVSSDILHILEKMGSHQYIHFIDEPPERSEVRLMRFLSQGGQAPEMILIDTSGAAGLTACDYLRSRLADMPILWICDRKEFETEAARMAVDFFYRNPMEQDNNKKLSEVIGQIFK